MVNKNPNQTSSSPLQHVTGVALPLGSLKTNKNHCVGEFLDLEVFADFCKKAQLNLIQLLPVNDTGTESSPYSALSAFALHPIYLSLEELPEVATNDSLKQEITALHQTYNDEKRFPYTEIRKAKIALLKKIFTFHFATLETNSELQKWIEENSWVTQYAVFMTLKELNNEASWIYWQDTFSYSEETLQKRWQDKSLKKEHLFHVWLQWRCYQQFLKASSYVRSLGILLKGDIPIMMNEDSVDVWTNPLFFNRNLSAGSPPDGDNPLGQNWGFPIYNWDALRKEKYSWWIDRLKHSAQFYDAYRLDHVLGFFRIWAIPQGERSGKLGYFLPNYPIPYYELLLSGFSPERIRWLSKPHVPTEALAPFTTSYDEAVSFLSCGLNRIGTEDMWLFKDSITCENDIWNLSLPEQIKLVLISYWQNRTLLEIAPEQYVFSWCFQETTSWNSLSNKEKEELQNLLAESQLQRELLWDEQAYRILKTITSSTSMIPCGEDLGYCHCGISEILSNLGILSLKVIRWCRNWQEDNQPFIPWAKYPSCSVATTSVHDSPTLRQWWLAKDESSYFIKQFRAPLDIKPGFFTNKTARFLLNTMAKVKSAWFINPIQDYLALAKEYLSTEPSQERINIPGTVSAFNWTYRIPVSVEELLENEKLLLAIQTIAEKHKKVKL